MLDTVLLILSIVVLLVISSYRPKHIFWDRQPVMRSYSDAIGKIGEIPRFSFNIDKKYNLAISYLEKDSFENAYKLVYDHFSPYFKINYGFFQYNIFLPGTINICLKDSGNIIGFIHGRPMEIYYNSKLIQFIYVDYLCVALEYRHQDAATLLISSMLNANSPDQSYIFKIDSNRLPFLPFFYSNYYYKLLESNKKNSENNKIAMSEFHDMELNKKTHILETINQFLEKYNLYKLYTIEELEKYSIYIVGNNDLIVIGKHGNYTITGSQYKSYDIDYIIGDSEFFHIFETYMVKKEFELFTIPYIGNNIYTARTYGFNRANKYSYYLYNYNLPKVSSREFMFNIN